MIKKYKKITFTRTFGSYRYNGAIEYGMHYIYLNNDPCNAPCFLISGWTEYRLCDDPLSWEPNTDDIRSEQILNSEPRISDLLPFHLWNQDGLPDNYIKHSIWHYRIFRNWFHGSPSKTEVANHWLQFSRNTLLHEGGGNPLPSLSSIEELPILEAWLKERTPFLQSRFHATMQKHCIEYITEEEMRREGYELPH